MILLAFADNALSRTGGWSETFDLRSGGQVRSPIPGCGSNEGVGWMDGSPFIFRPVDI